MYYISCIREYIFNENYSHKEILLIFLYMSKENENYSHLIINLKYIEIILFEINIFLL
jgi:hypothetical protein